MVRPIRKNEIKEELRDQLEEHSEQLQELGERFGETARRFSRATNEYVQENPWRTVAIAAGVGFLIGMLVMRDKD